MNIVLSSVWIGGFLFFTMGCGRPQLNFERSFERAVQFAVSTNAATIQLSTITIFSWDKVFLFHPYSTPEAIDKDLGFEWHDTVKKELEYSDAFELLVFVSDGRVVKCAKIRRKIGEWVLDGHNGFSPREAVFVVSRPIGGNETVLRKRASPE